MTSGRESILALFNNIGPWEYAIILAVLLLLFGGKKLPELARGLGRGLRHFKEELSGVKKTVQDGVEQEAGTLSDEKNEPPADDKPPKHSDKI